MRFYTGTMFPADYRGAIFVARHGSWNKTVKTGGDVVAVKLNRDGSVRAVEPFLTGFIANNAYLGRPVDVAVMRDGSLLVSDDWNGAIYRVIYGNARPGASVKTARALVGIRKLAGARRCARRAPSTNQPACKPGFVGHEARASYVTAIPLERRLPGASSNLPGRHDLDIDLERAAFRRCVPRRPYSVLLPVGFAMPPTLPPTRCALTAPFHPCRA